MRIDDISVAVVDINPSNMRLANSSNGGSGVDVLDLGYGDEYFGPKPSTDPSCLSLNKVFTLKNSVSELNNLSRSSGSDKSEHSKSSLDKSKDGKQQSSKILEQQLEEISTDRTKGNDCIVS